MDLQPKWLEEFVETACSALHAVDEMAPIGCHYACVDNVWEVSLFFSSTEVVGGNKNGTSDPCLFVLDVVRLLHIFDAVESASWQPFQIDNEDDLKCHFAVVGSYRKSQIWLRVLAEMPAGIEPGRFLDASQGIIHEVWE
ncbi:hypothetical protein [Planctomicrobium sp. SH527]|uniref:hypothetical protein n=1 Tax=Planctomicrobium sp. SH527 TaxID=3448123 RepID=UPI003F5BAA98